MAILWLAATGCNSVYHRTRTELPPEPRPQLVMRVGEAKHAESLAAQAASTLLADLARRLPEETIQADMDRLEMTALDLKRRAAAANDIAASFKGDAEQASEIERLHLRAVALLDYVRDARTADPAAQVARLDDLLRSPVAAATPSTQR